MSKIDLYFTVSNGTVCQATKCELHLGNYTRYDPKVIECIADNEKSTRISKLFHIDVHCKLERKRIITFIG